jgi:hypothetical protein
MDWGSGASETLIGSSGTDVFRIALNQGYDIISDPGGSDTLALYVGTQFSVIDTAWFSRDGEDLLVRIPDGLGGWLLDIRVQDMDGSGSVERLELYSGAGYRLTDSLNLIDRWLALGGLRNSFEDDFDRADGSVGNGWLDVTDNAIDLLLDNGAIGVAGLNAAAGIYRPIDLSSTDTVSFVITQHSGFGGLASRFSYALDLASDGSSDIGYGVAINRGDQNYQDSRVQLILDGVLVGTIFSPFQFQAALDVTVTVLPDGTVLGEITEGGNTFLFDFGPLAVTLANHNLALFLESPDDRSTTFIYPSLDDLALSRSVPEINLTGSTGDDALAGDAGADGLTGAAGFDDLVGGGGDDSLFGGAGADDLLGGLGDDHLYGGTGADALDGGDGDDVLVDGGSDADVLFGGAGADTASYVEAVGALTINLGTAGAQATGGAGSDTLSGIENLIGSSSNDTLTGDGGANHLNGWTGHDYLYGAAGTDTLVGLDGGDKLHGGDDADVLDGGDGADSLYGEAGADALDGGVGNDTLEGDAGNDTIVGGDGTDAIKGGADNDLLYGNSGADILQGHGGIDVLVGGVGADSLVGGGGADSFIFGEGDLGTSAVLTDLVTDYKTSDADVIDVSGIDADVITGGDQAFTFVAGLTGVAGQATLTFSAGTTTAAFDTNGDATADLFLLMTGNVTSGAFWTL